MSRLKLKSAAAHSVQCVRKLRIFHPQFSDTCVDDETVQRTDVDHYLYRLMLFSPVRIFSGHITHATIRLLVTVHVNKTKQKSPPTTGQWRLTLTVSQSEGWMCQLWPIRERIQDTMDREEYGTGSAVSSEHLRGQFGAKCVSPGSCCVTHLQQKNPENDHFNTTIYCFVNFEDDNFNCTYYLFSLEKLLISTALCSVLMFYDLCLISEE